MNAADSPMRELAAEWQRELREDREWRGCAGGPAFGPLRARRPNHNCLCWECVNDAGEER